MNTYILSDDGKTPIPCDTLTWAKWFETANRHVCLNRLVVDGEKVSVSTVFLGFDHNLHDTGKPVLWETMIFGGPHDQYQDRYTSLENAKIGHAYALAKAKSELPSE